MEKIREREIERRLVEGVKRKGGHAIKLSPTQKGLPDRLIILPAGKTLFVELKRPGGRIAAIQRYWQRRLQEMGHDSRIVSSVAEVDALLDEIDRELQKETEEI